MTTSTARSGTSRSRSSCSSPSSLLLLLLLLAKTAWWLHEEDYKKLDDQNNHLIEERLQQDNRIIDLEFEIQLLRDDLAYGPMEGSVAGFGDDLSAEEQAYQQAKQQHSS